MTPLTSRQFLTLRENAEVLEADGHGEKVLRLADGSILKLFRRKSLLSSSLFCPYAVRFARNAEALEARGIPCPQIIDTYRIPSIARTAVHYRPLPGETLRALLPQQAPEDLAQTCRQLGTFIADLHRQGVYFRSLHLGNVIMTEHSTLGLIDFADMRCNRRPLNRNLRQRNFRHLFRYARDAALLLPAAEEFITGYCEALPAGPRQHFTAYLESLFNAASAARKR
nr:toluene tolerance protein [Gammaproteobacteria bacterium]